MSELAHRKKILRTPQEVAEERYTLAQHRRALDRWWKHGRTTRRRDRIADEDMRARLNDALAVARELLAKHEASPTATSNPTTTE